MAITLRSGRYGNYYGSDVGSSGALTTEQMQVNATYIYKYLKDEGFTVNAISGMLGNMTVESSLNPGRWQSDIVGNMIGGYGLVQWTPTTNYTDWVYNLGSNMDPSEMDNNLGRIIYELRNNLQYIATTDYPETFNEFAQSTKTPTYLATAFLKNYERAGVEAVDLRVSYANTWYTYLTGNPPGPTPTTKKKKKFNFVLFNASKRRNGGRIYG